MSWLKASKTEILLTATAALLIVLGLKEHQNKILLAEMAAKEQTPASNWLEVSNIYVPDFILGENPLVVYDRTIKNEFNATWSAEIKPLAGSSELLPTVCTGSGVSYYEKGEALDPSVVTLSWLTGVTGCPARPGRYMGIIHYEIRPLGNYPTKNLTAFTNIFTILPKGSQLYITPEQVRKLDNSPTAPTGNPFKTQPQPQPSLHQPNAVQ